LSSELSTVHLSLRGRTERYVGYIVEYLGLARQVVATAYVSGSDVDLEFDEPSS